VTSIGNASQLVLGGINRGHGSIKSQQLLNITGSMLALGASEQAVDMLGDLKTTHLLRAAPRVQFYAQCCGAVVSIFMSAAMYVLFSEAYPCINDLSLQDYCSFPAPDVGPYRAIAIAVTSSSLPIPPSSGYFSVAVLVYAFAQTFVKYKFIPLKYWDYVPNLVSMGIAFILNTTTYPQAVAFGATIAFIWQRKFPAAFVMYGYAIAAGMIAGEGLGGIVGAILQACLSIRIGQRHTDQALQPDRGSFRQLQRHYSRLSSRNVLWLSRSSGVWYESDMIYEAFQAHLVGKTVEDTALIGRGTTRSRVR
jgi:uncharacterized oligopeptide transporter (OPT) family protein